MTKTKRAFFPLVLKIWLVLMLMVVACLGIIYLFTIVFLEDYYVAGKKREVMSITDQVVSQVLKSDYFDAKTALEDEVITDLAMRNSICIDIMYANGVEIAAFEGIGVSCYVHSSLINRSKMFASALQHPHQMVINEIRHPQFDTQYFVCCKTFSKYPDSADGLLQNGYVVLVTAPLASVSEAATAIHDQLISLSAVLIAAATIVAFVLAYWITRPMKRLSEAAKSVAAGNLDTVVNIRSHDEMGICAENFNEMVRQLGVSNTMQREMIANVSHDLRTPLTMIRGYAESIQDIVGEDKQKRDRQLSIIIDETERLGRLVTDIMDLSLLQAGRLKLNVRPFSVVTLMSDTLNRFLFLQENEAFMLDLQSELPSGDAICMADPSRMEQVLYNFINNAATHSRLTREDGTPYEREIILRVVPSKKEGFVRVMVCDKGEGIDKESLPYVWDRYYKPYRTAGSNNSGTGLGLSIVKAILTEHHFAYGVSSTPGKGSIFWFELPLAPLDEAVIG